MLERGVDVEEDGQPVVEAGPPDAPLVDEGSRARASVSSVVDAVVDELRVDDDLGRGPRLDGVDDRLRLGDDAGRQDPGLVVHGLTVDRVGERRPGGTDRARREQQQGQATEGSGGGCGSGSWRAWA